MPTLTTGLALTDDRGTPMYTRMAEPREGSVVLTNGIHGTAYQRQFSDGLWRSAHSKVGFTWADLIEQRNLVLVYDAPERVS